MYTMQTLTIKCCYGCYIRQKNQGILQRFKKTYNNKVVNNQEDKMITNFYIPNNESPNT